MVCIRQHPITGTMLNPRDYYFTTKAYEMMTSEEITLSNQRFYRVVHKELSDQIKGFREFREASKKSVKNDKTLYAASA